jgi:hypothetical protein
VWNYANGIDRRHEEVGVQLIDLPSWSIPWITDFEGVQQCDITNPHRGADIILRENIHGGERQYVVSLASSSPLCKDPVVMSQWMNERHDLERFFPYTAAEHAELTGLAEFMRKDERAYMKTKSRSDKNRLFDAARRNLKR